ncbi:MAG: MotA/TolQ/ExbB proton channel family protein, partial [Moraxellaceae bacterium]
MSELYQHIVEWTLWALIAFSLATWTLILAKGVQHFLIGRQNRIFTKAFWRAADLNAAAALEKYVGPTARLAAIGFSTLHNADAHT